jgi:copper chaperone CopZ
MQNVGHDQLVLIRVEGMHCHKCEASLQKGLGRLDGVYEVEVDFNSHLVSVLHNQDAVSIAQLMEAVREAGYQPTGFTQRDASAPSLVNDATVV